MPRVEVLSDPTELRRCIRDLLALSALPAILKSYDPHQIADSVAAALVSMLDAEFVYISLRGKRDDPVIEIARTDKWSAGDAPGTIRAALREILPGPSSEQTLTLANPIGEGTVRISVAPIGFSGDAVIIVGSQRSNFPTATERLLLGVAANEATIALQRWQAEKEERIRRTEQELRLVIDTIPALVWSALPDGSIDFVNHRLLEYTGLRLEDVKGWGWAAEWHPEGCAMREARLRRADGEYRWFLLSAVPLRDELGNIVKWYGTATDIEDGKRVELALRRNEAYLAEAQRLSRTGSFGWNVSSGELLWSEESFRIFGYDRATKPTLQLVLQRVHPDDFTLVQQFIEHASHDGKDWDLEHRLLMPDGSVRYLHVVAHASRDESGNREFMGAVRDVTAAKRAEQELHQAQANLAHVTRVTALGELTASIAHEVNQPLTGIVIHGEAGLRWLNRDEPNLDAARDTMSHIIQDGRRAAQVIENLRALAKKSKPHFARLDINDAIQEILVLAHSELIHHNVALKTELFTGDRTVFGDRVELQQIMLNLIRNGIEAMNGVTDRPKVLTISSEGVESDGCMLVAVKDTGAGIDPANADRIFESFFTTKPNGMGMGLSICRSIIEAHGGRFWVSPNMPHGAIFQFTLPTNRREPPATKQATSSS